MGCWSVYCGVSNISLYGDKVVLLPLRKNEGRYGDYREWVVGTLPIFGTYDCYGEIKDIERDFNTEFIEKVFDCSIEKFCHCLLRSPIDQEDGYSNLYEQSIKKISKLSYMWIKREVWDFMINFHPEGYGRLGSFDFGDKKLLEILGIEYVGENVNDKRYNRLYKYNDQYFASDGSFLHCCPPDGKQLIDIIDGHQVQSKQNTPIYRLKDLKKVCPDLDVSLFENKESQHIFKYTTKEEWHEMGSLFGYTRDMGLPFRIERAKLENVSLSFVELFMSSLYTEEYKETLAPLDDIYIRMIFEDGHDEFLNSCADLVTLMSNMICHSKQLEPFKNYITPQCGEHKIHSKILTAFQTIVEDVLKEQYDYEDEEEDDE